MTETAQILAEPDGAFPKIGGMRYLRFLKALHERLEPEWYLEIGTFMGASLQHARCKSIAVDPEFKIQREILGGKPALHCLAMTSDEFFASGVAEALGARFDLAFLDGMHRFEFLLRDFMGAERLSSPDGTIVLHDCIPLSYVGVEREWDTEATKAWTGDVWKVVPILRRYRPDLKIRTVDCPPSGLVMVSGLDPDSRVLEDAYEEIVAAYMDARLTPVALRDLTSALAIEPARQYLDDLAAKPDGSPVNVAIKIPAPRLRTAHQWGEFYFGQSLAEAFEREGLSARIDCHEDWERAAHPGEFDLVLRGNRRFEAGANPYAIWILSQVDRVSEEERASGTHVFFASDIEDPAGTQGTPLLHCTDPGRFFPQDPIPERAQDILFVGACYPKRRASGMVAWAVEAGLPVSVIGARWDWLPEGAWIRRHIRNSRLREFYASAGVVLNDHPPDMRAGGYVNNRVFDVLACAAPLISDPVAGLPNGFAEFIYTAEDPASLKEAVAEALGEDIAMKRRRREFAAHVRAEHSFDARVAVLIETLGLKAGREKTRKASNHA